ncbi:MAG: hypothetical protein L0F89_04720, partial [Lactococcus raffinolactis]|nr:hypothetical protein [Lactococcus raffinolactis]
SLFEETNFSSESLSAKLKGGILPDSVLSESRGSSVTSLSTVSPLFLKSTMSDDSLSTHKKIHQTEFNGLLEPLRLIYNQKK